MCLHILNVPDKKEGIGYKVVRKINETTFKPYYNYFAKSGIGGVFSAKTGKYDVYKTSPPKYYIGKTYTVKHKRFARTTNTGQTYRAGVHLYKELTRAQLENGLDNSIIIRCKYEEATFCDGVTIVAKKITPLSIVE